MSGSSILSARWCLRAVAPALDDLGIGALRHRRQAERVLAQALQALGGL